MDLDRSSNATTKDVAVTQLSYLQLNLVFRRNFAGLLNSAAPYTPSPKLELTLKVKKLKEDSMLPLIDNHLKKWKEVHVSLFEEPVTSSAH